MVTALDELARRSTPLRGGSKLATMFMRAGGSVQALGIDLKTLMLHPIAQQASLEVVPCWFFTLCTASLRNLALMGQ